MSTEPVRVLSEGTIRYLGVRNWGDASEWLMARVFVVDYMPAHGFGTPYVTVIAREPMHLPFHRVPSPVGSLHHLPAYDESDDEYPGEGDLLTIDVEALVNAR